MTEEQKEALSVVLSTLDFPLLVAHIDFLLAQQLDDFKAALAVAVSERGPEGYQFIDEYLPGGPFYGQTLRQIDRGSL